MIRDLYIVRKGGKTLFHMSFGSAGDNQVDQVMFGALSGTVEALLQEMGQGALHTMSTKEGFFFFTTRDQLTFVAHATTQNGSRLNELFIKVVENEFFRDYSSLVEKIGDMSLKPFKAFKNKVELIHQTLSSLQDVNQGLLRVIPFSLGLTEVVQFSHEATMFVKDFPITIIADLRSLDKKIPPERQQDYKHGLGFFVGSKIAEKRFHGKVGIEPAEVAQLLKEISVLDHKDQSFSLKVCPECRAKHSLEPYCHFFRGFVEGALDNPRVRVEETSCQAMGQKTCTFTLVKVV